MGKKGAPAGGLSSKGPEKSVIRKVGRPRKQPKIGSCPPLPKQDSSSEGKL